MKILDALLILVVVMDLTQALAPPCTTSTYEFSKACYWRETVALTWEEALISCTSKGGSLAIVDSPEAHRVIAVEGYIPAPGIWIGLTDGATQGVHRWTSGWVLGWHDNWLDNGVDGKSPNNLFGDENCVVIVDGSLKFDDISCSEKRGFVCQSIPKDFYCRPSNPRCASWLQHRFGSFLEDMTCASGIAFDASLQITSVYDCLKLCQYSVHAVCRAVSVGNKCLGSHYSGENLQQCEEPSPGTTLFSRNFEEKAQPRQEILRDTNTKPETWYNAKSKCEAQGYRLLSIRSQDVQEEAKKIPTWLALTDEGTEGVYQWLDGVFSLYQNWSPLQPTGGYDLNCAYLNNITRLWESVNCSEKRPYVCMRHYDHCTGVKCLHDGSCENEPTGYKCHCRGKYGGRHCEKDMRVLVMTYTYVVLRFVNAFRDHFVNVTESETKKYVRRFRLKFQIEVAAQVTQGEFVYIDVITLYEGTTDDVTYVVMEIAINAYNPYSQYELEVLEQRDAARKLNTSGGEQIPEPRDRHKEFEREALRSSIIAAVEKFIFDAESLSIVVDENYINVYGPFTERNECAIGACNPGGKCVLGGATGSKCECNRDYTGETCETYIESSEELELLPQISVAFGVTYEWSLIVLCLSVLHICS